MEFFYEGKNYKTKYFPFFRIKKLDGYQIFGLRYPSGSVEKVLVINTIDPLPELKEYLKFLVREYVLEDEEALTTYAKQLKEDIHELFE